MRARTAAAVFLRVGGAEAARAEKAFRVPGAGTPAMSASTRRALGPASVQVTA